MNKQGCGPDLSRLRPLVVALTLVLLVGCVPAVTQVPTLAPPTAAPSDTPPPPTAVPPTATVAVAAISHVYAFGDSLSDNGNAAKLLGSDWRAQYYWQGRASNGPVAVEVLAARLNVPLTDYAVYAARSDNSSLYSDPRMANTGALAQLISFRQDLKGASADPNALYFVWIGGTDDLDALGNGQPLDVTTLTDQTTDNIVKLVTGLSKTGARHFLVIPVVDLADEPTVTQDHKADAGKIQNALNTKVTARLTALGAQLNLDIKLFDYLALSAKIRANPSAYGLINLTDPCQPRDPPGLPACTKPDQYFYWDELHPTRRAHQIFGEAWAGLYQP